MALPRSSATVTHTAKYPYAGFNPRTRINRGYAACKELLDAVRRVKPMLHIFGHVHGGYGTFSTLGTLFVDAALPGEGYDLSNTPHMFFCHSPNDAHVADSRCEVI
jgi:Icc-related predicted phosphoesterase